MKDFISKTESMLISKQKEINRQVALRDRFADIDKMQLEVANLIPSDLRDEILNYLKNATVSDDDIEILKKWVSSGSLINLILSYENIYGNKVAVDHKARKVLKSGLNSVWQEIEGFSKAQKEAVNDKKANKRANFISRLISLGAVLIAAGSLATAIIALLK